MKRILNTIAGLALAGSAQAGAKRADPPSPTLGCSTISGVRRFVAPRNCSILYPNLALLGGVQMQDLRPVSSR